MYAMAAGIAMKMLGSISDANSQAGQYNAQSQTEASNANLLDQRALTIGAEGARNEEQIRRQGRQSIGTMAAAAGEGAFNSSGSPLDVVGQAETNANLDVLNTRYAAQSEARGYRIEAGNARVRSALATQLGKRAKLSGYLNAAATAVGGYGMMASGGMGGAAGGFGRSTYALNYGGGVSRGAV